MRNFSSVAILLFCVLVLCTFTPLKGIGNTQRMDSSKLKIDPYASYVGSFRYYNPDGLYVVVSVYVDPDNTSQVTFGGDLRQDYFTATGSYSNGYVSNFDGNDITYSGPLQ